MHSRSLLTHSCRDGCDSPHDRVHDLTKIRDSCTTLVQGMCPSACQNKSHSSMAGPRSQRHHTSQSLTRAFHVLESWKQSQGVHLVPLAKLSQLLFNGTESNSRSWKRTRTITSSVARTSESFVRPHVSNCIPFEAYPYAPSTCPWSPSYHRVCPPCPTCRSQDSHTRH